MFLKNLTLKGFKSFADSTSLDLEPGITVVVGPNGSGKSNVVDAIAWVLGAQAPSAVRSQKMDDVIFAGTTKRSALGRAEVSLTIDNSGGINFPELTATATLNYRVGPYRLRLQQRYIDSTILNINWIEGIHVDDNTVESQTWSNASFAYAQDLGNGATWEASLSINNLFDTQPPPIASYGDRGGAQTVSNNYDVFGRRYSLGFKYNFR